MSNDAIVGSRRAGFTPVADHVAAPFFTSLLRLGMVPVLSESWSKPSKTKRMTCSVGEADIVASPTGFGAAYAGNPAVISRNTTVRPTQYEARYRRALTIELSRGIFLKMNQTRPVP